MEDLRVTPDRRYAVMHNSYKFLRLSSGHLIIISKPFKVFQSLFLPTYYRELNRLNPGSKLIASLRNLAFQRGMLIRVNIYCCRNDGQ